MRKTAVSLDDLRAAYAAQVSPRLVRPHPAEREAREQFAAEISSLPSDPNDFMAQMRRGGARSAAQMNMPMVTNAGQHADLYRDHSYPSTVQEQVRGALLGAGASSSVADRVSDLTRRGAQGTEDRLRAASVRMRGAGRDDRVILQGGNVANAANMPHEHLVSGPAKEMFNRAAALHEASEISAMRRLKEQNHRFRSHVSTDPMINDVIIANRMTGPGADELRAATMSLRENELRDLRSQLSDDPRAVSYIDQLLNGGRISRHARRYLELRHRSGLPKMAALRDLPYLARGVMSNLREHTFPDIRARFKNIPDNYLDTNLPLKERAQRIADLIPSDHPLAHVYKDTRNAAALDRLARMYRRAGADDIGDKLLNIASARMGNRQQARLDHVMDLSAVENDMRSMLGGDAERLRALARGGWQGLPPMSHTLIEKLPAHLGNMAPADAEFLQKLDVPEPGLRTTLAKKLQDTLENEGIVTGSRLAHVGGKRIVVGAPGDKIPPRARSGGGIAFPFTGAAMATTQEALAHELGHATGIGAVVTAPIGILGNRTGFWPAVLPDEFRAQMRAQDIMRDWERRGITQGLPAELSTMTPEQLKEHTLPLSTYADGAARQLARFGLTARDKLMGLMDRLRKYKQQ